jgi:hypothetical protein
MTESTMTEMELRGYQEPIAADHVRKGFYDDDDLQILGMTRDEAEHAYRERAGRHVTEYVLSLEPGPRFEFMRELCRTIASTPRWRWVEMHLTEGPWLKGWLFETDEDES